MVESDRAARVPETTGPAHEKDTNNPLDPIAEQDRLVGGFLRHWNPAWSEDTVDTVIERVKIQHPWQYDSMARLQALSEALQEHHTEWLNRVHGPDDRQGVAPNDPPER
jgi:hypothetical protein